MSKQPKTTEPKLESLRKEDLIRMVRKQHKQIAKLQADTARLQSSNAVEALRVLGKATQITKLPHGSASTDDWASDGSEGMLPLPQRAGDVRTLTEAAFVAALDKLPAGVKITAPPAFPWSTSALLPTVSPIKPEDK